MRIKTYRNNSDYSEGEENKGNELKFNDGEDRNETGIAHFSVV